MNEFALQDEPKARLAALRYAIAAEASRKGTVASLDAYFTMRDFERRSKAKP